MPIYVFLGDPFGSMVIGYCRHEYGTLKTEIH